MPHRCGTEAKHVAQHYFRKSRPALSNLGLEEHLDVWIRPSKRLELSDRNNASASYRKQIKIIRKLMPKVTSRIELNRGIMNALANINEEDERIIGTLEGLVPSAALSYRQAIIDLADDT